MYIAIALLLAASTTSLTPQLMQVGSRLLSSFRYRLNRQLSGFSDL